MNLERYTDDGIRVWHNASTIELLEYELYNMHTDEERMQRIIEILARLINAQSRSTEETLRLVCSLEWYPSDSKED